MAKLKKKGVSGQARNFITRTQAVRKLQLDLADFRRLAIFKGIYPREPRNKKKASKSSTPSTTFYYTKDIQYLLHEPLLGKIRELKSLEKKITKSLSKGELGDAARLERQGAGKVSLDSIIRERYPTFIDALRDLDDALSLLFLFANLPSTSTIPPKTVRLCQRLCHEFELYIISSHSLRKSFLSIKGIYYQASIQGQDIMWLVPYRFVQRVTGDVDFRIMGTFIEFYTTLLGFVNFRLYSSIGLVYPPRFDHSIDEQGAELGAFSLEGIQVGGDLDIKATGNTLDEILDRGDHKLEKYPADGEPNNHEIPTPSNFEEESSGQRLKIADEEKDAVVDEFRVAASGADILPQPEVSSPEASTLFSSMHVFLSRETPRHPLEFVLKSFGCKRVSWDAVLGGGAFTHKEKDLSITHQIVDRPLLGISNGPADETAVTEYESPSSMIRSSRYPGRTYIQPQWVWDSINSSKLLRPDLYSPGAILPPHLSPWVKPKPGTYDPTIPLKEQDQADQLEDDVAGEDAEVSTFDVSSKHTTERLLEANEQVEENLTGSKNEESTIVIAPDGVNLPVGTAHGNADSDEFTGFDEGTPAPEDLYELELQAEAAGLQHLPSTPIEAARSNKQSKANAASQKRQIRRRQEEEDVERRLGMTSRKNRKLYEKMMHGKRLQDQESTNLRRKRRRAEGAVS